MNNEMSRVVPKLRFKKFSGEWKLKKLGDLINSQYNGQTPSRNVSKYWNGNINWLTSGELNHGLVVNTFEKITEEGRSSAHLKLVPRGTFLMAITGLEAKGTRGNDGIAGIDTTVNQSVMAIFNNEDLLSTHFLFWWYEKYGDFYGIKYTQGTKQQSYNAEIIKMLPITIPEKISEQKKISNSIDKIDKIISIQEKKLEQLKEIRKFMLQNMLV